MVLTLAKAAWSQPTPPKPHGLLRMASMPGLKSPRQSSSAAPFPTPPTISYNCQHSCILPALLGCHSKFSLFQARFSVTGNKQGVVRALRSREDWVKEAATFLSWAVSCSQGQVVICLFLEHKVLDASSCPQAVIFSSAPGGH